MDASVIAKDITIVDPTTEVLLSILPKAVLNEKKTPFYLHMQTTAQGWQVCYQSNYMSAKRKGYPVCKHPLLNDALDEMIQYINTNYPDQLNWN